MLTSKVYERLPLLLDAADFICPPEPMSLLEWSRQFGRIGGAAAGRFNIEKTPYFKEIYREIDGTADRVIVMSASQVGKSTALLMMLMRSVHARIPGDSMIVMQDEKMAKAFNYERFSEMANSIPELKELFSQRSGHRAEFSNAEARSHASGAVFFASARSPGGLRSRPIRLLCLDEVSAYPPSAGGSGDPVKLALDRQVTWGAEKTTVMVSTPEDEDSCRITSEFKLSDQRGYQVPCPFCQHFAELTWKRLYHGRDRGEMLCEECGSFIDESYKPEMLANGKWVSRRDWDETIEDYQEPGVAGFHISGLLSPFRTWKQICEEDASCYEGSDQMEKRRVWTTGALGQPWRDNRNQLDPVEVKEKTGTDELLHDSRILVVTGGLDVQAGGTGDGWLELVVMGWDAHGRGFGIDHRQFTGSTARHDGVAWQKLSEYVKGFHCELEDGRVMNLDALAVDVGNLPDAPREWIIEMEAVSTRTKFMPMKGSSDLTMRVSNRGRPNKVKTGDRAGRKIFWCGTQSAKNQIHASLKTPQGQPGSFIFPNHRFGEHFYRGLLSEQLVEFRSRGEIKRRWENRHGRRNESLDALVYSLSARGYLGGLPKLLKTREARRAKWIASPDGQDASDRLRVEAEERKAEIIAEAAKHVPGYAPTSEEEKKTAEQTVADMPNQADDIHIPLPHERKPEQPKRRVRRRRKPPPRRHGRR